MTVRRKEGRMIVELKVCDYADEAGPCGAVTSEPVTERWTTVLVGRDHRGDFCPRHSVDLSKVDGRDHAERHREVSSRAGARRP